MKTLQEAMEQAKITSDQLSEIAANLAKKYTAELDKLVEQATSVKDLTDSNIRNLILLLSLKAYSFSEAKEYAVMSADIAEYLRKEAYAKAFAIAEGTAGAKDGQATLESANEKLSETVLDLVSSLLKTKLDETHRIVDSLKSVLMSRMQEAKISAMTNADKAAYEEQF